MLQVKYTIFNVKKMPFIYLQYVDDQRIVFKMTFYMTMTLCLCDSMISVLHYLMLVTERWWRIKRRWVVYYINFKHFIVIRNICWISLREVGCRFPNVSGHKDENNEEEEEESNPVHHLSQEVPPCDDLPCRSRNYRCLRVRLQPGRNNMGRNLTWIYRLINITLKLVNWLFICLWNVKCDDGVY